MDGQVPASSISPTSAASATSPSSAGSPTPPAFAGSPASARSPASSAGIFVSPASAFSPASAVSPAPVDEITVESPASTIRSRHGITDDGTSAVSAAVASLLKAGEKRVSPSIQPRHSSPTMALSDVVKMLALVMMTVIQMLAAPPQDLFSSPHGLACTCTGVGESEICLCLPIIFIMFQGVMSAAYAVTFMILAKMIIGTDDWGFLLFSLFLSSAGYFWSVFVATPWQYRSLVLMGDVGVMVTMSLAMVFIWHKRAIWTLWKTLCIRLKIIRATPTLPT